MRILILNWRDLRSARGGGAERVTHEVARRLAGRGDEVTWLSSRERGLADEEVVDGVHVVRRGSELTTRLAAPRLARAFRPDVILEEINTVPYLAPLWAGVPVVLFMNQLARDVWWYEAPRPVAALGWLAEPLYLQAYRRCHAVTVSPSSRDDLRRLGIGRDIVVAPLAVDVPAVDAVGPRARAGRLVTIGRLTPSKRYDQAVDALGELARTHADASLTIVGTGRERPALEAHARRLGLADNVRFPGRISEVEKVALLDASDVLVGTSVREGWGLTVAEAAVRGTPAVVYDIPGFRDAVLHERTGLVVRPEPAALAAGVRTLLDDGATYDRLRTAAWERARRVTHEMTADCFVETIARAVAARR
jgi:glycosyltransferase involved in cell wall biosynthesis